MTEKLIINAEVLSYIHRIDWCDNFKPRLVRTSEFDQLDIDSLIRNLQVCENFEYGDGCIIFTFNASETDIKNQIQNTQNIKAGCLRRLAFWCRTNLEFKKQILTYLSAKHPNMLIELNQILNSDDNNR